MINHDNRSLPDFCLQRDKYQWLPSNQPHPSSTVRRHSQTPPTCL